MAQAALDKPLIDVQQILEEIKSMMGFVPPALGAVATDPAALRAAWWATRCGYLENPLPALFKEQFMAIIARYQLSPYSLIVRSCSLRRMGMTPLEIVDLFKARVPSQRKIIEQMRAATAAWRPEDGWDKLPQCAEPWVMWATIRMTLRRDPAGRCRLALHEVLGGLHYNKIIMLATFAAMQRVWVDSHPDIDPTGDARVQAQYRELLAAAPEFAGLWDTMAKRAGRHAVTPRERNLMAEIARQDRIRQKLRESESRFRRVIQNAAFPVMIYAQDGEVIMLNRAWRSLSGWSRRRIPTVQAWMKRAEGNNQDWSPEDMAALDGWKEPIDEGEHQIRTYNGQIRKWEFSTAAVGKLADGRNAFMRMATDVTVRRELETAVRESHQRVSRILESITDAFIAMDSEYRITWMNSEAARLYGCDRDAVIGRNFDEVFPSAVGSQISQKVKWCLRERQTLHFETFSDLLGLPIEIHAYGSDEGLTMYFHDISERKRMEEALKASHEQVRGILESITDAFVAFDREHRVKWMNSQAAEMIGCDRESVIGRAWEEIVPTVREQTIYPKMLRCLEEKLTLHEEYFSTTLNKHLEVHAYASDDGMAVYAHDISDRKEMEKALRLANQQLSGVLSSITDGFVALDRQHHITWMNQQAARMLRIDRDAALGQSLEKVLPPSARSDVTQQMMKCMEDGGTMHLEYYSDAIQAPIEMHAYGWEGGLSVHFRDISERKRVEEALRKSEQRFRGLFESDMIGIMFADRFTGQVLDGNDAFLKIIGYDRSDLEQGRLNWIKLTAPDHHGLDEPAVHAVGKGALVPYEKDYIHKDGHRVPVLIGGAPVVYAEAIVMAFVIDLTNEKQARRRSTELGNLIEAVIRSIPSAVMIYDLNGKVTYCNEAAERTFGWPLTEIAGKPNPMVPAGMWHLFDQQMCRVLAGETLTLDDLPCMTRSGTMKNCCFDAVPVKDKEGRMIGLMGIVRRVSEEYRAPESPKGC